MISRQDFIFTIGYDGPAAVVDGQAKRRYGSLSAAELAEKGLFRPAYSAAVYSQDPKDMEAVISAYNRLAGTAYTPGNLPDRLLGVFRMEDIKRVIII
ncbi:hypothetical protein [Breznakiella homolactica]|uniref:Uncharacterized protein n=1 Tax=Breznakiella homolactica TaxID=2798577 RepID=A0A7T8BCK1_9SPIR|nr:hypothetical protein [Breznakiella homolactica]QQO11210.1 hypothetical protein JFL75_09975 [Breznakiella homolactica]